MNFTLTATAKQLTPRLRCTGLSHLLSRSTSKIAVEVEASLLNQLETEEVKPRQHPGIVKVNHIELPVHINKALQRVIGDHPVKALLSECKRFNKFMSARHPPAEQHIQRSKMRDIVENVDKRMPPEKLALLSEDQLAKWQHKREQTIRRIIMQRTYNWKPYTYGSYEALVYAIGRGAHEYGVLIRILHELKARDPQFQPRSYFDFGSGVGTGMWAANRFWSKTIFEYYNVDSSREMHDLSELILRGGNDNQQVALRNVYYRQFLPGIETKYDLVVSSHTLFELPSEQSRKEALLNLWQKCDGYLILVEEGTRRGSELICEARDYLLGLEDENLKGHVFAPCPHDSICPRMASIADRTPCNFEVSYVPLRVGDVKADHLTARYSYVVLRKGESQDPTQKWPRLVRPTLLRSKHVICRMCTVDAKLQEVIFTQAKHGRPAFRCAKSSRWGDRLPLTVGEPFESDQSIREKGEDETETATPT